MNARAERRRDDKAEAKRQQYIKSGFINSIGRVQAFEFRVSGAASRSKYMPHIGKKQRSRAKRKG